MTIGPRSIGLRLSTDKDYGKDVVKGLEDE
jgi:hypothetical protein